MKSEEFRRNGRHGDREANLLGAVAEKPETPGDREKGGRKLRGWAWVLVIALVAWLPSLAGADDAETQEAAPTKEQTALEAALDEDPLGVLSRAGEGRQERIRQAAREFYAARDWQPAWTGRGNRKVRKRVPRLLGEVANHGLRPAEYGREELQRRLKRASKKVSTEAAASLSLLLVAEHLSRGRFDPDDLDLEWHIELREADLAQALRDLREGKDLLSIAPRSKGYRELVQLLRRWRSEKPWEEEPPAVAEGETMEEGGTYQVPRMQQLADRLLMEGALSPREHDKVAEALQSLGGAGAADGEEAASSGSMAFPSLLAQGVERFQERRGLVVDGKAGPNTLVALNESYADRLERLVLNLERWRWMPELPSGRHLWVNIPALVLQAFDNGEGVLEMPVVVGKPSWQTPVFRDTLTDVVINPYWNVPVEIAVAETIPKIRENPNYLQEENLEIVGPDEEVISPSSIKWDEIEGESFDFRFRQLPGPQNALGRIKFLFPNQFDVYFHDTPQKEGFNQNQRDLSHGCVRVARPLDLAGYVFAKTPDWSEDKVAQVISSKERTWVSLEEEIPVNIVYFTAYLDGTGDLVLRHDPYGYDAEMAEALNKRYGEEPFLETLQKRASAEGKAGRSEQLSR